MEMIKGIKGHGYCDELVIPIIENTPYEYELTDSLSEAVCYSIFQSSQCYSRNIYVQIQSYAILEFSVLMAQIIYHSSHGLEHKDLNPNSTGL